MSKAVIYTRVSTQEQSETESLNQQEKYCREFAVKRDLAVDKVFVEAGESAKTADRTQLIEMLDYCKNSKGEVKYVIVWKVDRFARRAEDHLTLRAILIKLGIQLLSATEPIENTNTGRLMETILAGFAEFDNGVRSERSVGGMKSRLEQGGWVHLAPIGYKNFKDTLGRPTLEVDEMALRVKDLLNEFSKGIYRQEDIIKYGRQIGITTKSGQPVSPNTVRKMLRNPVYAGLVRGKMLDSAVRGLHEPLINIETYNTNQRILTGKKVTFQPELRTRQHFPLRGFILCMHCCHSLTGSTSRGRNSHYSYYHCINCRGNVRVPTQLAHKQFITLLEEIEPSEGRKKLFKILVLREWDKERKGYQKDRHAAENALRVLEQEKNALIRKNLSNVIDDKTTKEQLEKMELRRVELSMKKSELLDEEIDKELVVDLAVKFMADIASLWREADVEDKQRFQKMIFPEGLAYNFGEGFGTATLSPCYELIQDIQAKIDAALNPKETLVADESLLVTPRGFEPRLPG